MKTLKYLIISVLFTGMAAGSGYAAGESGGRILNMTSFAKASAVGEAYTGRAEDLTALTYNPAGLVRLYGMDIGFSHSFYLLDTNLTSAGAAWKWGKMGFGFNWQQFLSRDTYRDEWGHNEESFTNRFTQLTFGTAFPFSQRVSMGFSFNSISEKLYDYSASALTVDAGLYILGFRGDSYGITLKNLGGELKHDSEGFGPETTLTLGGAHRMGDYIFSWDLLHTTETDIGWKAGIEGELAGLKLRGGVRYDYRPDFTMGIGIPYGKWTFDYAYSPHRDLGGAHRMTAGVLF